MVISGACQGQSPGFAHHPGANHRIQADGPWLNGIFFSILSAGRIGSGAGILPFLQ
jgi:hypothetical protein